MSLLIWAFHFTTSTHPLPNHFPIFHRRSPLFEEHSARYVGQIAERLTDAIFIQAPPLLSLKHERN
jgi:hypothetical protein